MRKFILLGLIVLAIVLVWHFTVPYAVMQYESNSLAHKMAKSMPKISGALAVIHYSSGSITEGAKEQACLAFEKALLKNFSTLKIVDRRHLSEILREQKFQLSAYADTENAVKAGKIVNATNLLILNLMKWEYENHKATLFGEARIVSVEKGTVLWVNSFSVSHYPFLLRILILCFFITIGLIVLSWILKI